ncbi:hypothetical protein [Gelatiniphilus marinus]|uniref:DUF4252 domain-containing protein n=1 Tax=Gelatiniphilus marinus TaxID=1759464 RepID=A0ABW5JSI5_9FLAO
MQKHLKTKNAFKHILYSLLMLICLNTLAQTSSKNLKIVDSLANKMFVDMNNRDYDAILDMMHPKAFNMVPKETLKELFKSTIEGNEEFAIEIPKTIPKYKLSEVFKSEKNNLQYAFVSYNMKMNMTFHKQEFDDESKKMMTNVMKAKEMDVKFITNNSLEIVMNNRVTIILRDDTTKNKWVMVNYDPDSPLFYQIVPEGLLEAAKTYKQDLMSESKKKTETDN